LGGARQASVSNPAFHAEGDDMGLIFPGMDPYLEAPALWPGVHASFIVYTRDYLQPLLRPRYLAAIEERVYLEGPNRQVIPDVRVQRHRPDAAGPAVAVADADAPVLVRAAPLEVTEPYIALLDRQSGQRVVAVIEVVSPTNKYAGPGRRSYRAKQAEVLRGAAHLIEIDLLRAGPHVLAVPEYAARTKAEYDYLVCVNRARDPRDVYELYPRRLRERLPRVRIPLADADPDVALDVQAVLEHVYEAGSYADRLDYDRPCSPSLREDDQAWADQRIAEERRAGGA
jgi:hypothetical protein